MNGAQLLAIAPRCSIARVDDYAARIMEAAQAYEITTIIRLAYFVAQIAWESGHFCFFLEPGSGAPYENRRDLGNVNPGDGPKYIGRSPIMLTGRSNYALMETLTGLPLVERPELASLPENAFQIAAAWWKHHGLNEIADALDFDGVTRTINGACTEGPPSHQEKRRAMKRKALEVLMPDHILERMAVTSVAA